MATRMKTVILYFGTPSRIHCMNCIRKLPATPNQACVRCYGMNERRRCAECVGLSEACLDCPSEMEHLALRAMNLANRSVQLAGNGDTEIQDQIMAQLKDTVATLEGNIAQQNVGLPRTKGDATPIS